MTKGSFITVEGVEGVGKSTHVQAICNYLNEHGVDVIATREPGGSPVAEAIRDLLLNKQFTSMHQETELLLMFAARNEHLDKTIRPALEAGKWVVCDRFTDASYAYQGGGREIPDTRIGVLEKWTQGKLQPNLTLVLDCDVELGLNRAKIRSGKDRFEQESVDFFQRVRQKYLERAEANPQRYQIIDASASEATVKHEIIRVLEKFVDTRPK